MSAKREVGSRRQGVLARERAAEKRRLAKTRVMVRRGLLNALEHIANRHFPSTEWSRLSKAIDTIHRELAKANLRDGAQPRVRQ